MVKGDTNIKPLKLDGSNGISAGMSYKSSPPFWLHIQPKENISRIKKQSYFSFLKRSESAVFAFFFARKSSTSATIQKILQIGKNSFLTNLFCRIMILTRIFRTRSSIMLEIAKTTRFTGFGYPRFGRGIFTHAIFAVPTPVVEIAISLAL